MNFSVFFFSFFFSFLFTNGLSVIYHKYRMNDKLLNFAMKTKMKFFYDLAGCQFCVEHHLAILPVIILFLMNYFSVEHIFIPFLVSSLLNLTKTIKK